MHNCILDKMKEFLEIMLIVKILKFLNAPLIRDQNFTKYTKSRLMEISCI